MPKTFLKRNLAIFFIGLIHLPLITDHPLNVFYIKLFSLEFNETWWSFSTRTWSSTTISPSFIKYKWKTKKFYICTSYLSNSQFVKGKWILPYSKILHCKLAQKKEQLKTFNILVLVWINTCFIGVWMNPRKSFTLIVTKLKTVQT